jgi:hypothetical protein
MVQVLDVKSGAVLGSIADMKGVHGIALAPDFNKGFISSGRDTALTIFDLKKHWPVHRQAYRHRTEPGCGYLTMNSAKEYLSSMARSKKCHRGRCAKQQHHRQQYVTERVASILRIAHSPKRL